MIHYIMTLSILAFSFMFWSFQNTLQAFPLPTSEDVMYCELHQTANAANSGIKGFPLSSTTEHFLSY